MVRAPSSSYYKHSITSINIICVLIINQGHFDIVSRVYISVVISYSNYSMPTNDSLAFKVILHEQRFRSRPDGN